MEPTADLGSLPLSLSHSDRWLDLVTVANLNLGVAEILYLLFWYISVQVSRGE